MIKVEIVERWGKDSLEPIPDELLNRVDLPRASKDFFRQVGFPKRFRIVGGADFEALPIHPIPSFTPAPVEAFMLKPWEDAPSPDGIPFLLLASGDISDYFLCTHGGDGVIALVGILTEDSGYTIVYVNSSVRTWMECQLCDMAFRRTLSNKEPTRAMVRRFKRDLEQIDPLAFEENDDSWPEHYWPLVVEDIMNYSGLS